MTGSGRTGNGPDPGDVAMALRMLEKFDLRPEDLLSGAGARVVPTFAEFVPSVREVVPAPSRRIYGTYWDRLIAVWGGRRLDEPTAAEVLALFAHARDTALRRRSSNGGKGAALHTYYALGCGERSSCAIFFAVRGSGAARGRSDGASISTTDTGIVLMRCTRPSSWTTTG